MDAVLQSLAKISTALLAGALLLAAVGLRRAIDALPDPIHIRVLQALIPTFRQLFLPLILISMAATGVVAWEFGPESATAWSAFALVSVVLAVTLVVNGLVNKRIAEWSPDTPPIDWRIQITRRNLGDLLQLGLSLTALLCVEISCCA